MAYKSEEAEKLKLKLTHSDLQKIAWRRAMQIQQGLNFDEKYPEDPVTAFLMAGFQYFAKDILKQRMMELYSFKPWKSFDNGGFRIFHQRNPGRRYVMGADVASGMTIKSDETDYSAAVVLDLETGEEMAAYRSRVTPQDFAHELADIGEYFYNAVIGVERNNEGGAVILTLAGECGYGAIFKWRDWTKRNKRINPGASGHLIELEGFPTTPRTRPVALNFLNQFVLEYPHLIWDMDFIREAMTFVRDEKGKPQASPGAHDDTVSARWIAHTVRRVQMGWLDPASLHSERYQFADRLVPSENAAA